MIVSDEDLLLQGAHVGGQDVQPVLLVAHLIHVDVHSRHVLVASCQSWVLTHTYTHTAHTHTHHTHTTHTTHIPHTHTTHTHHTHRLQLVFLINVHLPTQVTVFLITHLYICYSWYFSSHVHLPTHVIVGISHHTFTYQHIYQLT